MISLITPTYYYNVSLILDSLYISFYSYYISLIYYTLSPYCIYKPLSLINLYYSTIYYISFSSLLSNVIYLFPSFSTLITAIGVSLPFCMYSFYLMSLDPPHNSIDEEDEDNDILLAKPILILLIILTG